MYAIETKNLCKRYSSLLKSRVVNALDNLNLKVEHGKTFGLLGPNGAGKTTLIKILLGIVYPTSGAATLLDISYKQKDVRQKIGYLPENHRFPNHLTAYEILCLSLMMNGILCRKRKDHIESLIKLVDMERWKNIRLKKFSKGMLQRIGIAQSLVHDPELLILDEPTDGVDPKGRKDIRDLLVKLKEEGKTIFINSHWLSEIELVCDEVAILNRGKLRKQGTLKELVYNTFRQTITVDSDVKQNIAESISAISNSIEVNGDQVVVNVDDVSMLNKIIDVLRGSKHNIVEVKRTSENLEDYYINVINNDQE